VVPYFGQEQTEFEEQQEDEFHDEKLHLNIKNIPFIAYTVGSYFGDCDLFSEHSAPTATAVSNTERDSTAISDTESQFFVLQKDALNRMATVFTSEFQEI
jgi:hypothetical protein